MELAEQVRREFGAQLPAAPVRESHADRDRRQEQTKFELETKVLPIVNEQRVANREPALSEAEEDIVVELILSAMFLLPRLYGILAGEPLAEDVLVFPGQPVRVDRADGTKSYYPALARSPMWRRHIIGRSVSSIRLSTCSCPLGCGSTVKGSTSCPDRRSSSVCTE